MFKVTAEQPVNLMETLIHNVESELPQMLNIRLKYICSSRYVDPKIIKIVEPLLTDKTRDSRSYAVEKLRNHDKAKGAKIRDDLELPVLTYL